VTFAQAKLCFQAVNGILKHSWCHVISDFSISQYDSLNIILWIHYKKGLLCSLQHTKECGLTSTGQARICNYSN